jgi:Family of unknown function (DUF6502)
VAAVFAPLAQLVVARGLPYAAVEEALKRAIVDAAAAAHPQVAAHRSVSRISTTTGINRREVTRLTRPATPTHATALATAPASTQLRASARSPASEVFAHWLSDPRYLDRRHAPRVLPRTGAAPSFESLAQEVTRDVHPRSLLDELLRLKLARLDESTDRVSIQRDGFVPTGDQQRMLGFLSANVGDHLAAAVSNVLGDGHRHFEQAIFADGISATSMQALRLLIGPQWKLLLETLVPPLEKMIEADAALPAGAQRRVRIGLYAFDEGTATDPQRAKPASAPAPARRARKT